mgnify:CR=1 FL=1
MKTMNHSIVRCICAIIVGVLLVAWPEAAIVYLVIAIGALFFLPGIYAVLSYLLKGKQLGMPFPLVSIGSGLFGLWLMISPAFFVNILMYVPEIFSSSLSVFFFCCVLRRYVIALLCISS